MEIEPNLGHSVPNLVTVHMLYLGYWQGSRGCVCIPEWRVSVISDDQVPGRAWCHTHSVTGGEGQDCQIQILGPSTVFYDLISQT